jgi:Nudix N-terminal
MDHTPRYCTACGGPLVLEPLGEPPIPRLLCRTCGRVTYRNPAVGVAVVVTDGELVLLGRHEVPTPAAGVFLAATSNGTKTFELPPAARCARRRASTSRSAKSAPFIRTFTTALGRRLAYGFGGLCVTVRLVPGTIRMNSAITPAQIRLCSRFPPMPKCWRPSVIGFADEIGSTGRGEASSR